MKSSASFFFAVAGLLITALACIVAVIVPEIRCSLRLDMCGSSTTAQKEVNVQPMSNATLTLVSTPLVQATKSQQPDTSKVDRTRVILPIMGDENTVDECEYVVIRIRQGARTKELAESQAKLVQYSVKVNGVSETKVTQQPVKLVEKGYQGADVWWVYWDYGLGRLKAGNYLVEAIVMALTDFNDGWDNIEKGIPKTFRTIVKVSTC